MVDFAPYFHRKCPLFPPEMPPIYWKCPLYICGQYELTYVVGIVAEGESLWGGGRPAKEWFKWAGSGDIFLRQVLAQGWRGWRHWLPGRQVGVFVSVNDYFPLGPTMGGSWRFSWRNTKDRRKVQGEGTGEGTGVGIEVGAGVGEEEVGVGAEVEAGAGGAAGAGSEHARGVTREAEATQDQGARTGDQEAEAGVETAGLPSGPFKEKVEMFHIY